MKRAVVGGRIRRRTNILEYFGTRGADRRLFDTDRTRRPHVET